MSFKDFTMYWDQIEICNLSPDALDENVPVKWEVASFTGEWIAGASAGGCRNFVETFAQNPQFIITLEVFFPFFLSMHTNHSFFPTSTYFASARV